MKRRITFEFDTETVSLTDLQAIGQVTVLLTQLANTKALRLKTSTIRADTGTGSGRLTPYETKVLAYLQAHSTRQIHTVPEMMPSLQMTAMVLRGTLHGLKKRNLVTPHSNYAPRPNTGGQPLTGWSLSACSP